VPFVRCPPVSVFLEGVLHDDLPIPEELVVHDFNCRVACLEVVVRYKCKPFRLIRHFIANNLGGPNQGPERTESVVQQLLINGPFVEVTDEQVGANINRLWVGQRRLANPHGPAVQLNHV
jgi:hypothetical protein